MTAHEKEKNHLSSEKSIVRQGNENNDQIERVGLQSTFSLTIISRSSPQWLLALRWSQEDAPGKKIWLEWGRIAATEAYFEAKDNSFYKHGVEKLEKCWNDCITLKGDYVDE